MQVFFNHLTVVGCFVFNQGADAIFGIIVLGESDLGMSKNGLFSDIKAQKICHIKPCNISELF